MRNHKKEKCAKCAYHGWADGGIICEYIVHTKKMRPCPANKCTVFKKGRKMRRNPATGEPMYEEAI